MLVAPDLSQYGMILAPRWSCLSNGGEISVDVLIAPRAAGNAQSPTSTAQKPAAAAIPAPTLTIACLRRFPAIITDLL